MLIPTPSSTSLFHRLPSAVFCHVTNSRHPFVAIVAAARNPTRRNNNNNDVSKPTKQLLRAKKSVKYSKLSPVLSPNNKSELSESQSLAQMFPEIQNMLSVSERARCSFNNCLHILEQGCLVKGNWQSERYPLYIKLLDEIKIREKVHLTKFRTKNENDVRY